MGLSPEKLKRKVKLFSIQDEPNPLGL